MIQFDEHIFSDGLVQPPSSYGNLGMLVNYEGIWRWSIWGSAGGILEKNQKLLQNMVLYQFVEGKWIAGC